MLTSPGVLDGLSALPLSFIGEFLFDRHERPVLYTLMDSGLLVRFDSASVGNAVGRCGLQYDMVSYSNHGNSG